MALMFFGLMPIMINLIMTNLINPLVDTLNNILNQLNQLTSYINQFFGYINPFVSWVIDLIPLPNSLTIVLFVFGLAIFSLKLTITATKIYFRFIKEVLEVVPIA